MLACVLHFVYELSGNNLIVGFIAPINESIFEHTKLIFIPLLIVYLFYFLKNKDKLDYDKYFFSMLVSIILGVLLVPMIYYFYTESFGITSLVFDILITFIALSFSNLLFYNYYNLHNFAIKKEISNAFLIIIILFYMYASTHLIDLPIFIPN